MGWGLPRTKRASVLPLRAIAIPRGRFADGRGSCVSTYVVSVNLQNHRCTRIPMDRGGRAMRAVQVGHPLRPPVAFGASQERRRWHFRGVSWMLPQAPMAVEGSVPLVAIFIVSPPPGCRGLFDRGIE